MHAAHCCQVLWWVFDLQRPVCAASGGQHGQRMATSRDNCTHPTPYPLQSNHCCLALPGTPVLIVRSKKLPPTKVVAQLPQHCCQTKQYKLEQEEDCCRDHPLPGPASHGSTTAVQGCRRSGQTQDTAYTALPAPPAPLIREVPGQSQTTAARKALHTHTEHTPANTPAQARGSTTGPSNQTAEYNCTPQLA